MYMYVYILSRLSRVWLFATLWIVSGLPFPPPGDTPDPGIELTSLTSPVLAGGFFNTSTTWEAYVYVYVYVYIYVYASQVVQQ